MEGLRMDDVRRALETRDPSLVDMVVSMASQSDPYRGYGGPEPAEGTYTIHELRGELRSWGFRYKTPEEQFAIRTEGWKRIESSDHPFVYPDRYKLHEIVDELHGSDGAFAREALLEVIRRVPIRWGAWRGLKSLYKEAETSGDLELFGALVARIDSELSNTWGDYGEVSRRTLLYLSRRAWRWLRSRGETFPAAYVDAAVAVLREYPSNTSWRRTWVANHIMFHNAEHYGGRAYGQSSFKFWRLPDSMTEHRAFAELWALDSRPMFGLLERARSEQARSFAIEGLKADFRGELRELDTQNVVRLCAVDSGTVHDFVVWLFDNSPKFEQAAFRDLGLHDVVIGLLDSPGSQARKFAAKYARTHARDLPIEDLLRLANHHDDQIRKLSAELLKDHDPRKDVGLRAWGQLLGTDYGHDLAVSMIHEHFGAGELTLEWFRELFESDEWEVLEFATELFTEIHDAKKVSVDYFMEMFDAGASAEFAAQCLDEKDPTTFHVDVVRKLYLNYEGNDVAQAWFDEGRLEPSFVGVEFWRALAFSPTWREYDWAKQLLESGPEWARDLSFDGAQYEAREILSDVRNFTPGEVGFEWLMSIVRDGDEDAREWASEYLFEAFSLAEFGEQTEVAGNSEADLGQKTFLFTGKLSTMTRSEAQKKVADANGKKASGVTKTLDYLVIGDEGSPLYGQGSKGSKQKKADSLIADGAAINIISETAFLQMLAGGRREFSEEDTVSGCETLWEMGCGEGVAQDAPEAVFARTYLRRHHSVIGPRLTDKTVEEGRRIPDSFLTFERFLPLFTDTRASIRKMAIEMARHEMARWKPSLDVCLELTETRRADVRTLIADALLADDTKENGRLRVPPEAMDADGVYRFCESLDRPTRALGMALIEKYPQFADPEALFRLTDSPDRRVRAFVIKAIWRLYRDRHATDGWEPRELATEYEATASVRYERGPGLPGRPADLPANQDALRDFLRRILFGVPPGRLPKGEERGENEPQLLPAGRAKLFLLEVMRDLALEEQGFAELLKPLLTEFARTLGKRERGACLVALARIEDRWEVEND